jgi:hypothetical protein
MVPNLDFYAADDDWFAVLETVFDLGLFRVFESDSEPDCELREFQTATDVTNGLRGRHLALFVVGSGPEPAARRIDFLPGARGDTTFRYCCEGWVSFSSTTADPSGRRSCDGAIPTTTRRSVPRHGRRPCHDSVILPRGTGRR